MKRTLVISITAITLSYSLPSLAQPSPAAPVAQVDAGAAGAVDGALPPPVAEEPTTPAEAVDDIAQLARDLRGDPNWFAASITMLLLLVYAARVLAFQFTEWFEDSTRRLYLLALAMAVAQQVALAMLAGDGAWRWSMLLTAIVGVLGSGKLWDVIPFLRGPGRGGGEKPSLPRAVVR